MKKEKLYVLEQMPITRSIIHLALPSVLSMLVNILYNLTDTFFIGKLNDPYQVAAVSISLPLFTFQMAIAGIFGNGGGSYLSRLLGKKQYQEAHETATTAIFSSAASSILLAVLGILSIPLFLKAVGASGMVKAPAYDYMFIILLGTPFIMLKFTLVQLLRAEGAAKAAMAGLFIGTGVNIILDPLFIFVFKMGVTGAAVATVIGQGLGASFYLYYYLSGRSLASPGLKYLCFKLETYRQILYIGIPASLSQIMMSIGNTISYKLAADYGDHAVAALGVAARVFSIPIFVFIGISVGVQALIGYNYGARNYPRMKKAIRTSITISLWLGAFFTLMFALFPAQLITAFIKDVKIMELGTVILEAYVFAIPMAAIGMILMASLQAMGKALPALIVALSRQGIAYIPLIYLLTRLYGFEGLVFALPLADYLTTAVSFGFVWFILRGLKTQGLGPVAERMPETL
ncbi:MAG TPA: MATE family efflux transporter [Candidatus Cloacimonadota bacterium]|nr:MATE family efflux transporter [Candidatus Cloacimonadota bacterium]